MTVAHTSISAYHDEAHQPSRRHVTAAIYSYVASAMQPVTRKQISDKTGFTPGEIGARVRELINAGKLRDMPETAPCPLTGNRVKLVALA